MAKFKVLEICAAANESHVGDPEEVKVEANEDLQQVSPASQHQGAAEPEPRKCPICFEELTVMTIAHLDCQGDHEVCRGCAEIWFAVPGTECPICRQVVKNYTCMTSHDVADLRAQAAANPGQPVRDNHEPTKRCENCDRDIDNSVLFPQDYGSYERLEASTDANRAVQCAIDRCSG